MGEAVQKINTLLNGLASGSKKSFGTAGDEADKGLQEGQQRADGVRRSIA